MYHSSYGCSLGMVVWFFISPVIVQSSKSVYTRIRMLSKISNFAMSAIPSYVIMSKFYPHLLSYRNHHHHFSIYGVSYQCLLSAVTLLHGICHCSGFCHFSHYFDPFSTMIRDVQMVVQSLVWMLLYLTPILWNMEGIFKGKNDLLLTIMKLNPFYYIVEGYGSYVIG